MDKMSQDMIFKSLTGYPDQAIVTVPDLADAVTLTAAVGGLWANGYGAAASILAAVSNTTRKRIKGIMVSAPSAADEFQIQILSDTTSKAQVPVVIDTATGTGVFIPFPHPVFIEAGAVIYGKVACKGAVQRTIKVKLVAVEVP